MGYVLLDSTDTVQVFSPTIVSNALFCTIQSSPSGSILVRTIPPTDAKPGQQSSLLTSLSDAVESILQEGTATAAQGTQGIDPSGLLYDAVIFTVTYVPPYASPGQIEGTVEIPVNVITADTQFGSFVTGGSAADQITAEYEMLKRLAGG